MVDLPRAVSLPLMLRHQIPKGTDTDQNGNELSIPTFQSTRAISRTKDEWTQKRALIRGNPMANVRLYKERRRNPSTPKAQEKIALWEERFRRAQSPESRYGAMAQIRRWTFDHLLIQMWEDRDPRFNDMTWTFPG